MSAIGAVSSLPLQWLRVAQMLSIWRSLAWLSSRGGAWVEVVIGGWGGLFLAPGSVLPLDPAIGGAGQERHGRLRGGVELMVLDEGDAGRGFHAHGPGSPSGPFRWNRRRQAAAGLPEGCSNARCPCTGLQRSSSSRTPSALARSISARVIERPCTAFSSRQRFAGLHRCCASPGGDTGSAAAVPSGPGAGGVQRSLLPGGLPLS